MSAKGPGAAGEPTCTGVVGAAIAVAVAVGAVAIDETTDEVEGDEADGDATERWPILHLVAAAAAPVDSEGHAGMLVAAWRWLEG